MFWKQFSRGIRESVERCNWFGSRKDVKVKQESQLQSPVHYPCRFLPCLVEKIFCKPVVHKHKNVGVGDHHENKDNRKEDCNKSNFDNQYTFYGAVGWSGALMLGYVLSQRMWYKKKCYLQSKSTLFKNEECAYLIRFFSEKAESQPINNTLFSSKQKSIHYINSSATQETYGDKEFDEAAKELKMAHQKIMGEAENRKGVACLSRNSNHEAIEHFRRASQFDNGPAAFNLGLCHELGIGTKQDFNLAAQWYELASDRGHATAMYNLGVFYAHGWGGLKANVTHARHLFQQAAQLGQVDAQAAIDSDPSYNETIDTSILYKVDKKYNINAALENININLYGM
uniref:Death ligand signal enhancer n=1 Tax=Clastoptera arizonana TaxID=38151 RepID=A0A1B6DZK5_9HEMI